MSRIGRKPVNIPAGVTVSVDGGVVPVKGPQGTLKQKIHPGITVQVEGTQVHVGRPNDENESKALHGTTRSLINNMVIGVTKGFQKELQVNGVGYRAQKQGKNLVMNLGFSHQVTIPEVDGITIECPTANKIVVHGADKQQVGQFASEIREKRPPEPYKGKGIKYSYEHIRRKEGKAGKTAKK